MPSITIKADEFKYPTRMELRQVNKETPKFKSFAFPHVLEIIELINNNGSMEDVVRRSHLHWWNHCLMNRVGSLTHAYGYALVHFNRGLPDNLTDYEPHHYVNRVQFGFYSETYFYFFISVRDTVAQLLNVYFSMGTPENRVFINESFKGKIANPVIKNLFETFLADTTLTSEYRNGLAHRFPITHSDHRPSVSIDKGSKTFSVGIGNVIKSSELVAEVRRSISVLAKFLDALNPLLT